MNSKTEITMKDIAEALGLSRSTVSRALQGHPHISADTKAQVMDEAKRLGYQYNAMAASLRKKKSNTIGLIVPRISRYYQSAVITAIQNRLHENRYNLMICQSNESPEIEKELVDALFASRVEGLIVSTTLYTTDFSVFDIFARSGRPLVFFDRTPKSYPAHKIQGDDYKGGYLAADHLLRQGCRNIAYIGGATTCSIYRERYDGYRDALANYGIVPDEEMVFFHDLTPENAVKTFDGILRMKKELDAIFAGNDTIALALVTHAKKLGMRLPDELKIVGYSNDPLTDVVNPSITSVEQHPYEVGEQSASLMLGLIGGTIKPGKNYISVTIPVELVERESSQKMADTVII
ncbi:LacI family transcriptional regulator [Parapedobacter composti]|uniref:LacI family transcriptional regulator n=1 Tax=Parapedobacter composti TaxID=623281 RepID=A0A1I1EUG6_9SPHI|nr:LacI family DNA-binding transcriptional regulator [Parapedobacter composti]SFB90681.1 LacI family transcriptional regulator [Parapedobacter composti]